MPKYYTPQDGLIVSASGPVEVRYRVVDGRPQLEFYADDSVRIRREKALQKEKSTVKSTATTK